MTLLVVAAAFVAAVTSCGALLLRPPGPQAPESVRVSASNAPTGEGDAETHVDEGDAETRMDEGDDVDGPQDGKAAASGLPARFDVLREWWWVPASSVVVAVALTVLWGPLDLEAAYQMRVVTFLSFLVPLAVIDARESLVPNRLLIALVALRVPLAVWEAAVDLEMFWATIRGEVTVGVVVGGFFLLLRLLPAGGIGMGDVKLLALMPIFLGPQLALTSIMASLLVSFVLALWMMASRRKSRKDAFPMVPSIVVGTIAAVVLVTVRGVAS